MLNNLLRKKAVVVAQLVKRLLPTPEIRGSNPNIGKFYLPIVNLNRKDENKEKVAGNGPSLKNSLRKNPRETGSAFGLKYLQKFYPSLVSPSIKNVF